MPLDAFKTNGSSPPVRVPDFQLIRQSTIFLLEPLTDAARAWVAEHISADTIRYGSAIVVEQHGIDDIVTGIALARLTVDWSQSSSRSWTAAAIQAALTAPKRPSSWSS